MTPVSSTFASATSASAQTGFVSPGPHTSLYTPPGPVPGELVVLCTWLGAAKKHIAKYTTLYQRVAPGARILIIECRVQILVSSYARQGRYIQSAVAAVLDTLAECKPYNDGNNSYHHDGSSMNEKEMLLSTSWDIFSPCPKIVLHAFSGGGANTATQLLLNLHRSLTIISSFPSSIPLRGILLDSCPAKGTYWKSYDAMVLSLPSHAASKIVGALAGHIILALLYTWIAYGNENPASLVRRTLLNGDIVKTPSEKEEDAKMYMGRLCYLYSKEDKITQWTNVREHAEEAQQRGWMVEEEVFQGSAHCAHISADRERYTKAVKRVWTMERKTQNQTIDEKRLKSKL